MKKVALLTLPILLSGCVVHISNAACISADYQFNRTLKLDASGLSELTMDLEAGSLKVIGETGRTEILVDAEVFSVDAEASEHKLELRRDGDKAVLVSEQDDSFQCFRNSSPKVDMTVRVPADLALTIDDGSGSIEVVGMTSALDIDDGSGPISVDGGASLEMDDGSGELSVTNIAGDVYIDDGSGSVVVTKVGGEVSVEDGSGSIVVRDVKGVVKVDDGSGNILLENTGGVIIIDDGSGDLKMDNINGPVKID